MTVCSFFTESSAVPSLTSWLSRPDCSRDIRNKEVAEEYVNKGSDKTTTTAADKLFENKSVTEAHCETTIIVKSTVADAS